MCNKPSADTSIVEFAQSSKSTYLSQKNSFERKMALYNLIFIVGVAFVVAQSEALVKKPCICPAIYAPVCGSDGKSYSNECVLNCEKPYVVGLTKVKNGLCEEVAPRSLNAQVVREPCICTFEWAPVCGSDGNTYGNKCVFNCEQRYVKHLTITKEEEC